MADTLTFDLVSPEKVLATAQVEMVVIPGAEGHMGVLPLHAPVLTTLKPGVIDVYEGGEVTTRYFVGGGFADVTPEGCTVLADDAVPVSDITPELIEERRSNGDEAAALAMTQAIQN